MIDNLQTLTGFQFFAYVILQILTSPALYIGIGIALFLFEYFKSSRLNDAQKLAMLSVMAAEQIGFYGEGVTSDSSNKAKFDYVFTILCNNFPNLDSKVIDALIEGAVYAMNSTMKR